MQQVLAQRFGRFLVALAQPICGVGFNSACEQVLFHVATTLQYFAFSR